MIRMIQSTSAQQAKAYFSDAILKSDYYLNDQELNGEFRGKLAARINLTGLVTKDSFFALCENRHPLTGTPLTPRTKDTRTTGYDINFHCPKSVSIVHVLSKDDHILQAFRDSVAETMADIEADSTTRVRKAGQYADRITGELIWVDFIHQTARPVAGQAPDPHLHAHCYVFNATWDQTECRVKAGQFRDIKRDMPYYQALFHKRLSDTLIALGYDIIRTDTSFEIAGVPQAAINLFSKRSNEIGRIAQEQGITDAKALNALGAKTRSKKQIGLGMCDLKSLWRSQIQALQLPEHEQSSQPIRYAKGRETTSFTPQQCVDHAIAHGFERVSVLPYRRLQAIALRHSLGMDALSIKDLQKTFKNEHRLIHNIHYLQEVCTTEAVLAEEKRMVELARDGRGKLQPLYNTAPDVQLTGQQGRAIRHVLTCTDRVAIIRGAAGTGKTTLMREAVDWIEKAGSSATVVAPTSNASRGVLREEGFEHAETVALFLSNLDLQDSIKNDVLWVDEAGLLGSSDMARLLEIAAQQNARIILSGDARQHSSVARGDALRLLSTIAGIRTIEVNKIYRQKNLDYRHAVECLSKGNIAQGFEKLDSIGSIKTIDPLKPNEALVKDYLKAIKKGRTGLVICPTHKQGEAITKDIRNGLRRAGLIGIKETMVQKLTNLNLTQAEKSDWRSFKPGQAIQFTQNMPGVARGSVWNVKKVSQKTVAVENGEGKTMLLPITRIGQFDLFEQSKMGVSKGDTIRITRNSFDTDKKRLNNGQMLKVVSVKKGKITIRNIASKQTYSIDNNFGHLAHAHCITSYAAQGKTVDEVFIAQPAATFPATDAKQFYVSVSRGRNRARIYTDDKAALLEHTAKIGDRLSALELVSGDSPLSLIKSRIDSPQRKSESPRALLSSNMLSFNTD